MTTLKAGLIGCGFISEKHLRTLAHMKEKFQLVAAADFNLERLKKIETMLQDNLDTFTHYHDLLSLEDIDVVIITTPSGSHSEIIKASLLKGKHVIVEKPFTLSLTEADEIIELADRSDLQVLVCHQLRYRPMFQEIKKLLDTNQFGKQYTASASIQVNRPKQYYQEANWRGTWDQDGGMMLNQGLHVADLLIWYMGEIESIYGRIENHATWKETEDVAVGLIQFKNGSPGTITANALTRPNNIGYSLDFVTERGTVRISGPSVNRLERFYLDNPIVERRIKELTTNHEERFYMYEDFHRALTIPQHKALMTAREAKKVLEFIFGLYYSAHVNEAVHFPITAFSTADMKFNSEKGGE